VTLICGVLMLSATETVSDVNKPATDTDADVRAPTALSDAAVTGPLTVTNDVAVIWPASDDVAVAAPITADAAVRAPATLVLADVMAPAERAHAAVTPPVAVSRLVLMLALASRLVMSALRAVNGPVVEMEPERISDVMVAVDAVKAPETDMSEARKSVATDIESLVNHPIVEIPPAAIPTKLALEGPRSAVSTVSDALVAETTKNETVTIMWPKMQDGLLIVPDVTAPMTEKSFTKGVPAGCTIR
jgi:hypothetical protein